MSGDIMATGLPAVIGAGAIATLVETPVVPAMIAAAGDQAAWRYVEFFAANLNNDHTRPAYARACSRFFAFCEDRGLSLAGIRPFGVAVWVKLLDSIPTETLRDLRDRALIATREPDRG